ncbi:hypothetical protein HPB50_026970 [Hyalomma asiaticum]|uniref:Uncharacterized protein n=1 Tax=Hyalomma asiaticum TaxID=266040 RepID=A0ACB7T0F7_HYAAI|nr:hypothetical protein HPB50_026970 [Hyalomma asiaticum]
MSMTLPRGATCGKTRWTSLVTNSVSTDKTPNPAFAKNGEDVGWENMAMEFGSNHNVLKTHFKATLSRVRQFKFVDYNHFRNIQEDIYL